MAEFINAQSYLLPNEGGYTTLDGDTYRGIARRFFPYFAGWTIIDANKPLTQGEVIQDSNLDSLVNTFYYQQFWSQIQGDKIERQPIANYCYDWYVNSAHNAVKCIQEVLGISADGIFGNGTLNALNEAGDILTALHDKRVAYYQQIAVGNNAQFLNGWLSRANSMYDKLA